MLHRNPRSSDPAKSFAGIVPVQHHLNQKHKQITPTSSKSLPKFFIMSQREAVFTDKAPAPLPFFSQAIKCQGMVYCSGSIGMDPKTNKLVEGSVGDRTVSRKARTYNSRLTSWPGSSAGQSHCRAGCRRKRHWQRRQSQHLLVGYEGLCPYEQGL
jgi:hypothetical protein